jgi:hypothetical protein
VLVASLRRFISGTLGYQLGLEYGDQGFAWVERRSARAGRFFRFVERWMRRIGAPLLILIAIPGLCAIAGATKVPARTVYPCALLGQVIYVGVTYAVGAALAPWTKPILAFIANHVWTATVITALAVAVYELVRRHRQRRAGSNPASGLPEV